MGAPLAESHLAQKNQCSTLPMFLTPMRTWLNQVGAVSDVDG
jgi:hypothetical protein